MPNLLHKAGLKALNANNHIVARDLFIQAVQENPETAESWFYLGQCHFYYVEIKLAISAVKKYLELTQNDLDKPENRVFALDLLGQCYEKENNGNAALQSYQDAIKLNQSCSSAWHNMGLLYMKSARHYLETDSNNSKKFFDSARIFILKAMEICAGNPMFLHTIASWHEQYIEILEKATDSENAIQKKIDANFKHAIQHYIQALLACSEQDLTFKDKVISNLAECLAQYGHYFYRNKNYHNALDKYLEAIQLVPCHLAAINQAGMSLFRQGCFSEAREYFVSILEKTKDTQELADAWLNITCTYRMEKNWNKADAALNHAKRLAPEDPAIVEEAFELAKSRISVVHIPTSQTLFGYSTVSSSNEVVKIAQEPGF